MIGTTPVFTVVAVLKVVVGIETFSPMTRLAFSRSVMRSWGWARVSASPADLIRLMVRLGSVMLHIDLVMLPKFCKGMDALPPLAALVPCD